MDERAMLGLAGLGLVGLAAFFLLLGDRDPPGGVVTGRVLTTDGRMPWSYDEHVRIDVRWIHPGAERGGARQAQIGWDGRYRVAGLPEGVDLAVRIQHSKAARSGYVDPPPRYGIRAGTRGLDFELYRGLEISGRCIEASRGSRQRPYVVVASPMDATYGHVFARTGTNREGRFTLRGLPPGPHRLSVRQSSFSSADEGYADEGYVVLHESVHAAGDTDVRLRIPKRRDTPLYVMHDKETWTGSYRLYRAGTTRLVGYWRFRQPRGPPRVLARVPTGADYGLVVEVDGDRCVGFGQDIRAGDAVTLSLGPSKPLAGRLRRSRNDLRPLRGWLCVIRSVACFRIELDHKGRFEAPNGVYPGRYEIRYVTRSGTERVLARDVRAGSTDLDLVLR